MATLFFRDNHVERGIRVLRGTVVLTAQGSLVLPCFLCYSAQDLKPKSNLSRYIPILIAATVIALVCLLQALPRVYPKFDALQRMEWMTYDWRARQALSSSSSSATNLGAIFIGDDS